jgi:hypothetical protein
MKTGTLLQSFLLTAGLVLGGISAAEAHNQYSGNPGNGKYHHLPSYKSNSGHTPWWSSSRHDNHAPEHHWKHGKSSINNHDHRPLDKHDRHGDRYDRKDHWKHGKYDGHGDRRDHGDRMKRGKYDGHGDGRDHKGHRQYNKREGRADAGRKEQRFRPAGIGYTGRS